MSQIPTPAASFRRSQRLDCLIPLGDVGATTECADDVPRVVVHQRGTPFDLPFRARPRENGRLDDGKIRAEHGVEPLSERLLCPGGQARVDEVTTHQLFS
jgi:hypothetical protein